MEECCAWSNLEKLGHICRAPQQPAGKTGGQNNSMAASCCPGSFVGREIFPKATLKPSFPPRTGRCSGVAEIPQLNWVTSPDNAICDGEYTYMYTCHYIQRLAQINLVPDSGGDQPGVRLGCWSTEAV